MVRLFTAAALVAAIASPAAAQQIGNYAGVTSDGQGVLFTVGTDAGTGSLAITNAAVFFDATCSGGAPDLVTGWGYDLTQDIVSRKVANVTAGTYFTITFNLTFSKDGQSAMGRVSADSPSLYPVGPTPTKAVFCKSSPKMMTVNFQPASAKFTPPATGAVMLGKVKTFQP
jgi:hypothetical protein